MKDTLGSLKKYEDCKTCNYAGHTNRCMTYEPSCIINPFTRELYGQMERFVEVRAGEFKQFVKSLEVSDED